MKMKMKKNILAVAVLSAICGLAQADDVSNVAGAGSVDIFQIGATSEDNGVGTRPDGAQALTTITSPGGANNNEVNLVQGNTADNLITITQTATNSKANVYINANDPNNTAYGAGDRATGHVADVSAAVAGTIGTGGTTGGNALDGSAAFSGTNNTITVQQDAASGVLNIALEGTNNIISATQAAGNDGAVLNAVIHATNANYVISQ